jgi:hypothetical protein
MDPGFEHRIKELFRHGTGDMDDLPHDMPCTAIREQPGQGCRIRVFTSSKSREVVVREGRMCDPESLEPEIKRLIVWRKLRKRLKKHLQPDTSDLVPSCRHRQSALTCPSVVETLHLRAV